MERFVIFTGDPNFSVRKGVVELQRHFPDARFLILHHNPRKQVRRLIRNQWRNLKRNGWRWIPYQSAEVIKLLSAWIGSPTYWHSERSPGSEYDLQSLIDDPRVELLVTEDIHGEMALKKVSQLKPDLGISLAAPILKSQLFEMPRLGSINLHKGKVPDYRGMPPAFWECWNGEKEIGCTIHQLSEKLDAGDTLSQRVIERQPYSTLRGLQLTLDELGIEMTSEVVCDLARGKNTASGQAEGGSTYRKPTLRQIAAFNRRFPPVRSDSSLKFLIKNLLNRAYLLGYRPLIRALNHTRGNQELVVLLYHRVSDEFRDSVSVGIEQFEEQMAYIAQHYPIASIEEIIGGRLPQDTAGKPIVAVTFDDGYRDNYENAVPILLRHKIPAAFFVSTGMIGREVGFAHDLQRLGRALPNMNWGQLREMRDRGFTIGSHTVSHINCAEADAETLTEELELSKETLEKELSLDEVIFAYPFGKVTDMTPDALEHVKKTGYSACLSAYDGVNRNGVDQFNVLRKGVDFNFSRLSFIARVEGR